MGNKISHEGYCKKFRKFERPAAEQEKAEVDLTVAQKALPWSSEHLPQEKSQDTAAGAQNKDIESETASCPLQSMQKPVAQVAVRTTELQDHGETQPSAAEPEETETKPATVLSPDRLTGAPPQERAAGGTGVTKTDLPLQAAVEVAARDADGLTDQAAGGSRTVVCKRPSGKLCKPTPLCRWLKKLKSSNEKQ